MMDYPVVGIKETVDILESGQIQALSDVHNIEAALEIIRKSEDKIVEYKELKKKRALVIEQEIENLTGRVAFLKSVIFETLKAAKQKSVSFPGVGKVSSRKKKGNWVIKDEAALIQYLKDEGEYTTIVKQEETVQKGELNKLLEVWDKVGKVPTAVEREPESGGVSISFETDTDTLSSVPVPKKDVSDTE